MKMKALLCSLLLLSGMLAAQTTYQTLFLGNSYTGVNDLPSIMQSLTLAGGDSLIKDSNSPGGYTLQGHSTNATSLAMINARAWDFVVLQEQSQLPSFPQNQVQQQVYPYAQQLNDSIKENDSCTVTVFYMTWGRKYGDSQNCAGWPPVCTYEGMQAQLRMSYLNMANQNEALVAPCGVAWWECKLRDSTLELFSADYSHPSYAGSYLNGCVFYATMYRRSPIGLDFYGLLDSTTATFLQQVADDVVFDSLTQWRVGLDDAHADWTYTTQTDGQVFFSNASTNANSYLWDFGSGNTSTAAQPSFTFPASGTYPVQLIATNGCTSDTLSALVTVVVVGTSEPIAKPLTLFPNPSNGMLQIHCPSAEPLACHVYDLHGRAVHEAILTPSGGAIEQQLDLRHLPKGSYHIQLGQHGSLLQLQ